ncbi:MAG: RodZ domain-containing protein [Woeseiaceae bacterium]|jgi:cytoskeleton protein RodZ
MSDASDKSSEGSASADPQEPVCGERLAIARREQQISVLEIAKELHLDEPKVRAIERNEFDVIGAPVFAKGHLRKYAQLVGVDEGDVMADYYQLNRSEGMPPLVATRRRPRREMSPGPWIAVIVVLIIAATAYWWFTSPPAVDGEPALDMIAEPAVVEPQTEPEPEPELDPESEPPTTDVGNDDSAVLQSIPETVDAPPARATRTPPLADGQLRVLLTYSGDCWTEISDARGRRLFFGLGNDGRTVELSGEAPFNALFGNADNVRIQVNDSDRAISAAERRGLVARLTIAGS